MGKPVPGKCCKGVGVGVGRWRVEINKGCNEGFPSTGCGTHVCTPWGARPHVESHHVLETAGSKGARARGHKTHCFVDTQAAENCGGAGFHQGKCAASFIKCVARGRVQVPLLACIVLLLMLTSWCCLRGRSQAEARRPYDICILGATGFTGKLLRRSAILDGLDFRVLSPRAHSAVNFSCTTCRVPSGSVPALPAARP